MDPTERKRDTVLSLRSDLDRHIARVDHLATQLGDAAVLHRMQRRFATRVMAGLVLLVVMSAGLLFYTAVLSQRQGKNIARTQAVVSQTKALASQTKSIATDTKSTTDFNTKVTNLIKDATTPGGALYKASRESQFQNLLLLVNEDRKIHALPPLTEAELLADAGRKTP